ncbi:hypothetical protein ACWGID_31595 [Kribbella sp. NPDC054772]
MATTDAAPPAPGDTKWVTASAELRSTAKWLITALAAVAAVVFGAGPIITRPSLDFHDDAFQLILAGLLGAAGLIGIGLLVFSVSKVLLPVEMSLDDLPQTLIDRIEAHPDSVLPADASTLQQYRDQLAAFRRAEVELPDEVDECERAAVAAQQTNDVVAYQAAVAGEQAYREAIEDNAANLVLYESIRTDLIDRGAYTKLSEVFSGQHIVLWVGAFLAGIGGLGFQLALTSAPAGGGSSDQASAAGQVAMLSGSGGRAAAFWATYGLKACETAKGQVPVVISAGEGTAESPYVVRTVPGKSCRALQFAANPEVFTVVVPTPDKVTITLEKK